MRFLKALCLWVALASALVTTPANADNQAEARKLFKRGNELLQEGKYDAALLRFEEAYTLWNNPKILLNIATTELQVGRTARAADTYERYLKAVGPGASRRAEVEELLRNLEAKIGWIVLEVSQPDARVLIDNRPIPSSRRRVRVDPGTHEVIAGKSGYRMTSERVVIAAGDEKKVVLTLVPETPEPPPVVPPPPVPTANVSLPPLPPVPLRLSRSSTGSTDEDDLSHAWQVGVTARADIDGKFRGAAAAIGASFGIWHYFEIQVSGLLGTNKGLEPAASVYFLRGMVKPTIYVGAPIFFVDGARPGVHAAGGVQVDPIRHLGIVAMAGVGAFGSSPNDEYQNVLFVPSIGAQGRF